MANRYCEFEKTPKQLLDVNNRAYKQYFERAKAILSKAVDKEKANRRIEYIKSIWSNEFKITYCICEVGYIAIIRYQSERLESTIVRGKNGSWWSADLPGLRFRSIKKIKEELSNTFKARWEIK